ncbi:TetR family transcriptional regulator [Actinoplanes lobatus]|uniref:AcrR family transcriptional regulator n=1 Tax=Actinoplanes lobatus TaxID=113568 RepID=A0A7W7HK99_9ACTN|nr:TetR/AcrR family transcriptional regulator [Actinoplanes lobatus]MBB4752081.1 AcrR family transcriptional regulator [Actinoplanes lobatus]GGN98854.1 TetR family transcriptional regulator [Actinoplanes lobatus]GIE46224.1 TetR family transcriptional regulator [Actinoplanes lobatus]
MTARRADAQRNYDLILATARTVVAEQGTQASLRDIARRAGVGDGTLYRHFPTRDALLEALLRQGFDRLAGRAAELAAALPPGAALRGWLTELVGGAQMYRGMPGSLVAVLTDTTSPLHEACQGMREAAAGLLRAAQQAGEIRSDIDETDALALINSVGWIAEQNPQLASRHDRLLAVVLDGLAA